ncbi:MAG: sel1 repeat family protein [Gammaproteobacteria bacterium]|nr:sel1 repeat family protein [Gammaproteobacteria bacterium]
MSASQGDWVLVERFEKQLTAAKAGKLKAMYDVGRLYERGRGVDIDLAEATKWYKKASSSGQHSAQARLGIMYFEGRGVKQNYKKALKLLNTAAKNKVPSAQFQLANMYELGTGVPQNLKKAIYWYSESDKYGYYLAKNRITRLKNLPASTSGTVNRTTAKPIRAATRRATPTAILSTITNGQWFKRKKAVGYLPSNITNCVNGSESTLHCISTSQERSTGTELINYYIESRIRVKNKSSFDIVYSNNVLSIESLSIEDGDGNLIEKTASRIKKGKQGKKRKLSCRIKNKNIISCTKNSSSFDLVSR